MNQLQIAMGTVLSVMCVIITIATLLRYLLLFFSIALTLPIDTNSVIILMDCKLITQFTFVIVTLHVKFLFYILQFLLNCLNLVTSINIIFTIIARNWIWLWWIFIILGSCSVLVLILFMCRWTILRIINIIWIFFLLTWVDILSLFKLL